MNAGFPDSAFYEFNMDPNTDDPYLALFLSLVVQACYPNLAYLRDKRRVFTLEQATALLSKMSVCVPFEPTQPLDFPYPLFIFTEKVR